MRIVPGRKLWPLWLSALVTVATTVAVISIGLKLWSRSLPWPPFVAPAAALGIVIERDDLLPDGATWRGCEKSWVLRVFGVADAAAQNRLFEAVGREIQKRGKPHRATVDIEFWSGDPPPRGENPWAEKPRPRSVVVRTVSVP